VDEHPRPETTLATLAKLPSVFKKDGVVTAGSSSGTCFGLLFSVFRHGEVGKGTVAAWAGIMPCGLWQAFAMGVLHCCWRMRLR
jgi:acetyl-CoA acetyltransferase